MLYFCNSTTAEPVPVLPVLGKSWCAGNLLLATGSWVTTDMTLCKLRQQGNGKSQPPVVYRTVPSSCFLPCSFQTVVSSINCCSVRYSSVYILEQQLRGGALGNWGNLQQTIERFVREGSFNMLFFHGSILGIIVLEIIQELYGSHCRVCAGESAILQRLDKKTRQECSRH